MVARADNGMFGAGLTHRRHSRELHPDVVRYIEEELALGRSHRAIALSTGVDRKTVDQIASGEHVSQLLPSRYQRCNAGHLTILPCLTCACRQQKKEAAA